MYTKKKPPFLRRRLGYRLRTMRSEAGLNLDEAAAQLDMSRSALHRIEAGECRASVHLIRSMMDLYDCFVAGLLDEARAANKRPWYPQYGEIDLGYVGLEDDAESVRGFSGHCLPGLLQTEPLIRALFDRDPSDHDEMRFEEQVMVRLTRQRRLTDAACLLTVDTVVDEAALLREIGGPEVMRGQLKHMIEMVELPNVTIRILPLRIGAHSGLNGGYSLLTYPGGEKMLYAEYITGSVHVADPEEIRVAEKIFDRLCAEALNPADSVALVELHYREFDNR